MRQARAAVCRILRGRLADCPRLAGLRSSRMRGEDRYTHTFCRSLLDSPAPSHHTYAHMQALGSPLLTCTYDDQRASSAGMGGRKDAAMGFSPASVTASAAPVANGAASAEARVLQQQACKPPPLLLLPQARGPPPVSTANHGAAAFAASAHGQTRPGM